MSKYALIAVAVVAVAGMVFAKPMKRSITEEETFVPLDKFNNTIDESTVCHPETPCGWTVYMPFYKEPEKFVQNNYCRCPDNTVCIYYQDDISIGTYIHRCQKPRDPTTSSPPRRHYLDYDSDGSAHNSE